MEIFRPAQIFVQQHRLRFVGRLGRTIELFADDRADALVRERTMGQGPLSHRLRAARLQQMCIRDRFVADQIGVLPDSIGQYLTSEQNRRRHSAALLRRLNLRPFGPKPEADLVKWLLPQAIDDDRLIHLAALTMEECRRRGIIVPPPTTLDRICREVRHKAPVSYTHLDVYKRQPVNLFKKSKVIL